MVTIWGLCVEGTYSINAIQQRAGNGVFYPQKRRTCGHGIVSYSHAAPSGESTWARHEITPKCTGQYKSDSQAWRDSEATSTLATCPS